MAIRLRRVEGALIAVCAARSVEQPGDVYLDDEAHHALAVKFDLDFASEYGVVAAHHRAPEVALIEAAESNNPARAWWDSLYDAQAKAEGLETTVTKTLKMPVVLRVGESGDAERVAMLTIPTDLTVAEADRIHGVLLALAGGVSGR